MDEDMFSYLSIWIPLQDVDERNGCLHFIPKSHKIYNGFRTPTDEPPFKDIENELIKHHSKSVVCKAGDAVVFKQSTLHYSSVNTSSESRLVISCFVSEPEAFHSLAFRNKKHKNYIDLYKMNDEFLLSYDKFVKNKDVRPCIFKKYKTMYQERIKYTYDQFLENYKAIH